MRSCFDKTLTAVIGNLDLLKGDLPNGTAGLESLDEAADAARRAAKMSLRMLTFIGQIQSNPETVDLARLCHSHMEQTLYRLAKGIDLECDLPHKGPLVKGDPLLLEKIVDSLMVNAFEAQEGHQGKVSVSLFAVDAIVIGEQIFYETVKIKKCHLPLRFAA